MDVGELERGYGRPKVRLRLGLWEVWSILPLMHFYFLADAMAYAIWVATAGHERSAPILYGPAWDSEIGRRA